MPDEMTPPAAPGAGAPPAPSPAAPVQPGGMPMGATAPATVAPDSAGLRMRGMVQVTLGMNTLDKALGLLGTSSPEGQALAKALVTLRKTFGGASGDLQKQEVKLLDANASPVTPPTAGQGSALQQQLKAKLAGMGMQGRPAA